MPDSSQLASHRTTTTTSSPDKLRHTVKNTKSTVDEASIGRQVNMWDAEQIAAYYAHYASTYDSEIAEDKGASYPAPFKLARYVQDYFQLNFGSGAKVTKKVLDLGCGTGQSSLLFFTPPVERLAQNERQPSSSEQKSKQDDSKQLERKISYSIFGVDTAPAMLEKAQQLPFQQLFQHDLELYPYPTSLTQSGPFDAIVCVGVMDFIKHPCAFLQYARSMLSNDGVLAISFPESHDFSELSSFSRLEMETLITTAGYWTEKHERFLGYRDSQTGHETFYHGYLLSVSE